MTDRDALMKDPTLGDIAMAEAKRLQTALRLDNMDGREVYRSLVEVVIRFDEARVAPTIAAHGNQPEQAEASKPSATDGVTGVQADEVKP